MKKTLLARGIAMLACLSLLQAAQAAPDLAHKAAPRLAYLSAFADYKPYKDEPPADWRKLNDAVAPVRGSASGHAGHGVGGVEGPASPPPAMGASGAALKPQTVMPMRGGQHRHGSTP